jgi:hypothetical protein
VLEIIVLKKPSGPKMEETRGEWRKPHKDEHLNLYIHKARHVVKEDEMGGTFGTGQRGGNIYRAIMTDGRWFEGMTPTEGLDIKGKVILKLILNI